MAEREDQSIKAGPLLGGPEKHRPASLDLEQRLGLEAPAAPHGIAVDLRR
jgi:hypothetical protein